MSVGGTQKRDKKRRERKTVKELKQPLEATLKGGQASRGMPCHRIASHRITLPIDMDNAYAMRESGG